jgi:hypothetical protein
MTHRLIVGLGVFWLANLVISFDAAGATVPPVVTVPNVTVAENAPSAAVDLLKPKASSYSKVRVQTVDGTAKAGVDYLPIDQTLTLANTVLKVEQLIPLIDNSTFQGTRSFTVKLTCVRFCTLKASTATVTITDDDVVAPPPAAVTWTHCANQGETCYLKAPATVRYGVTGHYFTAKATGSIVCDVGYFGGDPIFGVLKTCDTDGAVGSAPAPAPPAGAIASAPLPDFGSIPNPCLDAHGAGIPGSWCPARQCPGYPYPVQVNYACPVIKP